MATNVLQNCKLYLDDCDFSGAMNRLDLSLAIELLDNTAFGASFKSKAAGLTVLSFKHSGFVNFGAGQPDDVLWAERGVSGVPMTICPLTGAAGDPCFFFKSIEGKYMPGAAAGKLLAFSVEGGSSAGDPAIRGTVLVPASPALAVSGANHGAGQNLGAISATQKLYAVLHLISLTGFTSVDCIIESAPASNFGSPTTRGTFANSPAAQSQYLAPVAGAVTDAYWRPTVTLNGAGPGSVVIVVAVGIR